MQLYYITDRKQFGEAMSQRTALLNKIAEAASCGVDLIQLREKDLSGRELESIAREAVRVVRENSPIPRATRLLINSRTDVAIACGADGVHLTSNDIDPVDVRAVWDARHREVAVPVIAVSCHTQAELARAAASGADYAAFAPVFGKQGPRDARPAGLEALRNACGVSIPVLALGGVTLENASRCIEAGAVGIAAIRLFQENNVGEVVERLRR